MNSYYDKAGTLIGQAWGIMDCDTEVSHRPHVHNPTFTLYCPYICPGNKPKLALYDTPFRQPIFQGDELDTSVNTYFATDGSYGDEDNLIVLDTSDWPDEKWERVSQMTDNQRYDFASAELFEQVNADMQPPED